MKWQDPIAAKTHSAENSGKGRALDAWRGFAAGCQEHVTQNYSHLTRLMKKKAGLSMPFQHSSRSHEPGSCGSFLCICFVCKRAPLPSTHAEDLRTFYDILLHLAAVGTWQVGATTFDEPGPQNVARPEAIGSSEWSLNYLMHFQDNQGCV